MPKIFQEFPRKESISDGISVYDFLGGAIKSSYKAGWEKLTVPAGQKVCPAYPPASEWTADWICCLLAARFAGDRFCVVELGAGYGQWMVTAIIAFKALKPEGNVHGLAVEADSTHYNWLQEHVENNLDRFDGVRHELVMAAAGYDGIVNFPAIENPSVDYGASYGAANSERGAREVPCLSMRSIDERFGEQEIDLLHVDIQGAEVDLMRSPGFDDVLARTKFALFGTHRAASVHDEVKERLERCGLKILLDWPRHSDNLTPYGAIKTFDGALLASSESLGQGALEYMAV